VGDSDESLRIDILTLFPEVFPPMLGASILGRASRAGHVAYHLHDIRDYSRDKHRKVDDKPYGGGPGMVIQCEPVFRAYEAVRDMDPREGRSILFTPQGRRFDQEQAEELSGAGRLILLCGHYEGFDERIRRGLPVEEVSVGDYVMTGGEIAAMTIVDVTVRLLPGVLGHADGAAEDSFSRGTLEHPHYTRPAEFRGMKVPDVLRSGNHKKIREWRRRKALERTRQRREDLLQERQSNGEENNGRRGTDTTGKSEGR